jgi:hypothetical protein
MKLLIMQFLPISRHFICLRTNYSQHKLYENIETLDENRVMNSVLNCGPLEEVDAGPGWTLTPKHSC